MKMKKIFKQSWILILVWTFSVCIAPDLPARMSLKQAKKKGIVTEQSSGYLSGKTPEGKKIAGEKNKRRRQKYRDIAKKKNDLTEDEVARATGKKLTKK